MKPKRLAELAVLTAVSLIIFIIELQIPNPFPIPGVKLGLANIITVYAVYHYKAYETAMIVAVRLILGSVFSGNVSALIYSAAGSTLCLIGMLLLRNVIDERHIWLSSVSTTQVRWRRQFLSLRPSDLLPTILFCSYRAV